jgi:hypothetical protein
MVVFRLSKGDEITMRGYKVLTSTVYNCHDNRAYGNKRSGILAGLRGDGYGFVWLQMGISLGGTCQVVRQHWFKICRES